MRQPAARCGAASDLLSGQFKAHSITTAFYSGTERTPSVVVRVDDIYTDYERRGFFRVGVLPLGVMEGFNLEVRQSESVTNSLVQMQNWIGVQASKRLEFRNVKILTYGGGTNQLESSRGRIVSHGRWELFGKVRFFSGTNELVASSATLQVTGPQTGQLIFATAPPCTNNLFTRIEFSSSNQKETP